jgi:colicin import membrane protein
VLAIPRRDPGANAAAVLAVGVHVLLLAVLFFGIRWRTKQPEPVMAELWSQLPAVEAPRAAPPPPPPVVAPKPEPKPEPRPEPKAEPKPEPKPDIALEQERKRKEDADKKQREDEAAAKKKREEELARKKRDDELKAKAEQERKDKALAEQRRRDEQAAERKRMQEQLARELSGTAPKAGAPAVAPGVPGAAAGDPSAVAGWSDQIRAKVRANIVLPSDLTGNPAAEFEVLLLPTGEVQSVRLLKSSGSKVLDDAWERAILKSSPLPKPAKADVFRRDLRLVFRPRD